MSQRDAQAMPLPSSVTHLTAVDKGLPGTIASAAIAGRNWNVLAGDLPFPVAVLKQSALRHNSVWMQGFIAATGVSIAPHGKTTMAPQLFHQQIADGCWGITVATVQQAAVAAQSSIKRILIANQVVGQANIAILVDLLRQDPALDLYCYVDSPVGVMMLREAVDSHAARPLNVLLEIGFKGGRTGCRSKAAIQAVLDALATAGDALRLRGVAGFEGLILADSAAATEAAVAAFLDQMVEAVALCHGRKAFRPAADGNDEIVVTAGGSAFFDMVAERFAGLKADGKTRIVIRSGCYLSHDHGIYADDFPGLQRRLGTDLASRLGQLQPALFLWAIVQSQPEPGLALLTLGKRDAGHDSGLPRPIALHSAATGEMTPLDDAWRIDKMNDQHGYLRMPADLAPAVGDLICLGISHPCTTFDKWRHLLVVNDDWTVIDTVQTFF